jgi:hypothetical protein
MPEIQDQVHQRYRIKIERAAVKGVMGYTIEVNGDDEDEVAAKAESLKAKAEMIAGADPAPEGK